MECPKALIMLCLQPMESQTWPAMTRLDLLQIIWLYFFPSLCITLKQVQTFGIMRPNSTYQLDFLQS
jgi:hypothetical protein